MHQSCFRRRRAPKRLDCSSLSLVLFCCSTSQHSIASTTSSSTLPAMSWDDHLNNLKARGLAHAAICDNKGASWFTASPGSNVRIPGRGNSNSPFWNYQNIRHPCFKSSRDNALRGFVKVDSSKRARQREREREREHASLP